LLIVEERFIAGAAKAMLEFARAARTGLPAHRRIDLSVATFVRDATGRENPVLDAFLQAGIPVDVVQESGRYRANSIAGLRRVVAARQPHIVLSNSVKSHFVTRLANLARSCRWIAYHHGYTRTSARTLVYNQLDRWSLRGAARVITVCNAFVSDLRMRGVAANRISVVPVPVNPFPLSAPEVCRALRDRLRIPDSAFVLLSVGRLSAEKGQADLVRALAVIRRLRPPLEFRCVFVGDGPQRSRLEKLARELAVGDAASFDGYQNNVVSYYSIADAFVLPSHSEGCPNVLLEAMAAGLPIVATAVGGVPEFATHEHDALLVGSRDPHAIALAVLRLMDNDALRKRLSSSAGDVAQRHRPLDYLRNLTLCFEQTLELEPLAVGAG
jgi:glycosyltransferase involved in cell wall biosynthesis